MPEAVRRVIDKLETSNSLLIGLVGLQGVGKSAALQTILSHRFKKESAAYRTAYEQSKGSLPEPEDGTILFKWRRPQELFTALLDETHELSRDFHVKYKKALSSKLASRFHQPRGAQPLDPMMDIEVGEKLLGRSEAKQLRQVTWLDILYKRNTILIDMPDYSKTDRRLMARDLNDVYWLWNFLSGRTKTNMVIAIQKELFSGHFFFDKMEKIELEPLNPEHLLESYQKRFHKLEPFTQDALMALGRMSRGIYRRFLRYITLSLDHWQTISEPKQLIDTKTVNVAVTTERLAEDMELELSELFPKQSDLRLQAVQLLLNLSESGPQTQTQLTNVLGMEPYAISRLLAKLELYKYVIHRRVKTDKMVSLRETQ